MLGPCDSEGEFYETVDEYFDSHGATDDPEPEGSSLQV